MEQNCEGIGQPSNIAYGKKPFQDIDNPPKETHAQKVQLKQFIKRNRFPTVWLVRGTNLEKAHGQGVKLELAKLAK